MKSKKSKSKNDVVVGYRLVDLYEADIDLVVRSNDPLKVQLAETVLKGLAHRLNALPSLTNRVARVLNRRVFECYGGLFNTKITTNDEGFVHSDEVMKGFTRVEVSTVVYHPSVIGVLRDFMKDPTNVIKETVHNNLGTYIVMKDVDLEIEVTNCELTKDA